jgi:outer membrane protein insertion porin family
MTFLNKFYFVLFLSLFAFSINAQVDSLDIANPTEYTVGNIIITGNEQSDPGIIKVLSGLSSGEKIKVPGDKITDAIKNLWKQGLYDDVKVYMVKKAEGVIDIEINVAEKPRLSKFTFKGVKKGDQDDIRERLKLVSGRVLTDYLLGDIKNKVNSFYFNKGYNQITTSIQVEKDPIVKNASLLIINVSKGAKVKIKTINISGNENLSTFKVRRRMKETKRRVWWNPFNAAKYNQDDLLKDEEAIIAKYNTMGYRDAKIVKDSVYNVAANRLAIDLKIEEGRKYYFRNISWLGNTKYRTGQLDTVLNIKKGDIFDQAQLESKLYMNQNGGYDITSLYMDDGYLFFQLNPVEINAENDSIDLEVRMFEGKQATINKVMVEGNTKTSDRVIMREIRTRPGQLFRRSDIMRTTRDLQQLGFFDPEKIQPTPIQHPEDGTVDLIYKVEEKASDQIQLSGGYGGNSFIGTLGLSFNNFSAKNFFKKEAWAPVPAGDGQKLSINASVSGNYFQSYVLSFTEPWLGGKKPTSLTVSANQFLQGNGAPRTITNSSGATVANPNRQWLRGTGGSVQFLTRLKWPDDYFTFLAEQNYTYYDIKNYQLGLGDFSSGYVHNISSRFNISRNSITGNPILPNGGSNISFTAQLTPPYSIFNKKDLSEASSQEKYKFLEFQKYKLTAQWNTQLTNLRAPEGKEAHNLILYTKIGLGALSPFTSRRGGDVPLERFIIGGSGLNGQGFNSFFLGRDIIAFRGYEPSADFSQSGDRYVAKYTAELRYPISLNPSATVFVTTFAEAANGWTGYNKFNPFNVKRAAGAGVRIFLPMFGLLGFDYAWGFDSQKYNAGGGPTNFGDFMKRGAFVFTIGGAVGEL